MQSGTDGVVAVHSLSKRSNLAGVRVGFFAGDADIVHFLSDIRRHAGLMVPVLRHAERRGIRVGLLSQGDVAELGHLREDLVAPGPCPARIVERVVLRRRLGQSGVLWPDGKGADRTIFQGCYMIFTGDGQFVQTGSVDQPGRVVAQSIEGLGHRTGPVGGKHTGQLTFHSSWIG